MRIGLRFTIACSVAFLALLIAISIPGCQLREMPNEAREAVESVKKDVNQNQPLPPPVPKDPKPRLVVDVTLSMAGYVSPPGHAPSEFSRALEVVASGLPEHDLFVFGTRQAGGDPSLEDLLVPKTSGLGRDFATDELFRGSYNQDDLLFKAVGHDEGHRSLVFFTDGVYSSPSGRGIQPVALALDELLQAGWSVGFIALRSSYYGIRCELSPRGCRDVRLFYSEASAQRGEGGFVPMPCSVIRNRPFYIVVLSPTSALFHDLSDRLGAVDLFLFEGNKSPIKLGAPFQSRSENIYDRQQALRWIMLSKKAPPEAEISEKYSVDPLFPVELVRWTMQAKKISWGGKKFNDPWISVNLADPKQHDEAEEEERTDAAQERLQWRTFPRDLESLQGAWAREADALGMLAIQHHAAIAAIQRWHPGIRELEGLYCEYLDQPSLSTPSRPLSMLRALLAADALRRQRPEEVPVYLGSLLGSSSEGNSDLEALAKDLAQSAGGASGATLAAATKEALPAGLPVSRTGVAPNNSGHKELVGREFSFSVAQGGVGLTYKLRFVPSPVRFSRHLRRLATGDDSDIAFADRTYRLDNLLEHLATAQLERSGAGGELTVYVTVPGR